MILKGLWNIRLLKGTSYIYTKYFRLANSLTPLLLVVKIYLLLCFHFSLISVVLWIGDLNYRISELDVDGVKELISKKDFATLHSFDQVILMVVSIYILLKSSLIY